MMRLLLGIGLIVAILAGGMHLAAQESTPEPTPDPAEVEAMLAEMQALATQIAESVAIAEEAADNASGAVDLAANMFGLFEAMSGAIGLVVPVLALAAGLIGFRRLESAQNELIEARERFEKDMASRELEFDHLRDELQESVQRQRENAGNASLALSLLPLGERQYRAQDYQGALDTYHRALALDPKNPIIHYRIGYVNTQSGELEKAKTQMQNALDLDPNLAPARAALGYIYRRMGDKLDIGIERDRVYNFAEQNFLEALNDSPRLMDEDGEAWWGALGGLYRRRGQIEQAIYAYGRGTEVTPQSSYPFSNLALLYAQTGNRDQMIETYKRVEQLAAGEVQSDTSNYWAYADLITSRIALGKFEGVWQVLDMGLETAPADSPYTLESLIDTLNRLRDSLNERENAEVDKVIARINTFKQERDIRREQRAIQDAEQAARIEAQENALEVREAAEPDSE